MMSSKLSKHLKRPALWLLCALAVGLWLRHGAANIAAALGIAEVDTNAVDIEEQTDAIYWNEMAEQYLHTGPISQVFKCYEKAVAINPKESSIQLNYGNSLFLFRQDAMEYYHLTEQQVFDRAFEHYNAALKVDPQNFALATDVAVSYYGVQPPRYDDAIKAWQTALAAAETDFDREGVYIHMARLNLNAGRVKEALEFLGKVKDEHYQTTKEMLQTRADRQVAQTSPAG